jgi:two-component sensor histidine kinase
VWIVFVGSITAARWRYLTLRTRLIDELVAIESARGIERDALARARESVAASVRPSLVGLREDIDRVLSTPEPERRSALAADLRRGATTVIRPLSHTVYASGERPSARRRPLRFLAAIVRTQPFRPLIVSTLYLATALPRNVQEYGFAAALPALALDAAFIIVILGGANLLMRRWRAAHAWIYIATLVVIHGIPLLLAIPGIAETDPQTSLVGTVIEIAVSLALLLGTSSLGLLRDNRDKALDALRHEVRAEELTSLAEASLLASAARELGSRLHGPVQSTVLASAAALEHAVDEASTSAAHAVLADAAAAIDSALQGGQGSDDDVPLTTLLGDVIEPWREICPVTVTTVDDIGALTGPQATAVATIVREAIANAYRHGQATRVEASIGTEGDHLRVRVMDDGAGPGPKQWGLGLTLIDRLTGGHWTLTRDGDRTVLDAGVAA